MPGPQAEVSTLFKNPKAVIYPVAPLAISPWVTPRIKSTVPLPRVICGYAIPIEVNVTALNLSIVAPELFSTNSVLGECKSDPRSAECFI